MHLCTKISSYFWNLQKITDFLIPHRYVLVKNRRPLLYVFDLRQKILYFGPKNVYFYSKICNSFVFKVTTLILGSFERGTIFSKCQKCSTVPPQSLMLHFLVKTWGCSTIDRGRVKSNTLHLFIKKVLPGSKPLLLI